jgi:hypothetical protein
LSFWFRGFNIVKMTEWLTFRMILC